MVFYMFLFLLLRCIDASEVGLRPPTPTDSRPQKPKTWWYYYGII